MELATREDSLLNKERFLGSVGRLEISWVQRVVLPATGHKMCR